MTEFFAGFAIGSIVGMSVVTFWTYPILENLREENGKLKIDLRYAGRGRHE